MAWLAWQPSKKHEEASEQLRARTLREARREEVNANLEALGIDARLVGGLSASQLIDVVEEVALMITRSELERRKY